MKTLIISMVLTAFIAANGYAGESLSLDEAITTALGKNPQAVEARESVSAAEV
jgi:hypothetical protein